MNKKRVVITVLIFAILAAVTIGGLVWTITQAVRSAGFASATATVTSCKTEDLQGEQVNVLVLVSYTDRDGVVHDNASYIGDLNRCYEGLNMKVYYQIEGDRGYVYSKSDDMGFALIMLCGGAVWCALGGAGVYLLNRSGYYNGLPD